MYNTKTMSAELPVDEFLQRFHEPGAYLKACRACPHYGKNWSCPPDTPDTGQFFADKKKILLVGLQLLYGGELRCRAEKSPADTTAIRQAVYERSRLTLLLTLNALKERLPGARVIGSGCCNLCEDCTRLIQKPCRRPDEMVFSFSVFEINFARVLHELWDKDLLWAKRGLPEYEIILMALVS